MLTKEAFSTCAHSWAEVTNTPGASWSFQSFFLGSIRCLFLTRPIQQVLGENFPIVSSLPSFSSYWFKLQHGIFLGWGLKDADPCVSGSTFFSHVEHRGGIPNPTRCDPRGEHRISPVGCAGFGSSMVSRAPAEEGWQYKFLQTLPTSATLVWWLLMAFFS